MSRGDPMVDAELVLRFKGGEESAFEALVRRHMEEAYAFCLRLTRDAQEAEELSQTGFVRAYRALREFRGEASFKSWLFRIFVNLYRDHRRRRRRAEARLDVLREEARRHPPVERPSDGAALEAGELAQIVQENVALLPDRQREVLILHLYEGMPYPEIARVLGCSYDDVKVNLSLARRKLKEALKEYL